MRTMLHYSSFLLLIGQLWAAQVNFLNWGNYIDQSTLDAFTQQTGITVNQTYYDSAEMQRAKLLANGSAYDLTVPDLVDIPELRAAGLLQPIDKAAIPNLNGRNQALYAKMAEIDPDNRYAVIYTYGTTGLVYNVDMIRKILGQNAPTDSWQLIFNPKYLKKLQSCGVSFLDDQVAILGLTLNYLGLNPNSTNPADFEKAAKYLMTLRPYVMYFNNFNYMNDLASGNVCVAVGYSGDVLTAMETAKQTHSNVHLRYVLPKEGAAVWFDVFTAPKGSPNPQATWQLINFLLQPKVAATNSNLLGQPNGIPASTPYLDKPLQQSAFNPSMEKIKHLILIRRPPEQLKDLIDKLWFQVLYGVAI